MSIDIRDMENTLKKYAAQVAQDVCTTDFAELAQIAGMLIQAKKDNRRVYTVGNGGSAATASHMANDLLKGCRVGDNNGFRAIALTDATPVLTCLANDFSYEDAFAIQLNTYAEPGDILIALSGSGNSQNVIRAVEAAKALGVATIGFTGRDGGQLAKLCDITVFAPTDSMEQLEDMHLLYEHALVSTIRELI